MSNILNVISDQYGHVMMVIHFAVFTVLIVVWRTLSDIKDNHLQHIYMRLTKIETQLEEREKK